MPDETPTETGADPETSLPLRAVHRWNLIIERKPELAYDYLSPGYRETHERADYANQIRNRPVTWTRIAYVDHTCGSVGACSITMKIDFKLSMPSTTDVESTNLVTEQWVKSDGQWYFLPDKTR